MTKINKILAVFLSTCLFFVVSSLFAVKAVAAPRLYLDPASETVVIGQDFQVNLGIDVGSTQAFGADATITFPPTDVTIKSVTKGDFFTDLGFGQAGGQVEIHGYFANAYQSKNGNGIIATITLTPTRAAGAGVLHFSCDGSGTDTAIIDTNGNNILDCGNVTHSYITFTQGPTPSPTATPAPGSTTSPNGPTNACGGTCGSIYNCNVNLFCYQGYCRNPDCPADLTCGCKATPTPKPTVKPKGGTTPTVRPSGTPVVVNLTKSTPFPTFEPVASPSGTAAGPRINLKTLGLWAGGILIVVALIIIIVNSLKKKGPPKINFPQSTYPVEPPLKSNPPPTQTPPPSGF